MRNERQTSEKDKKRGVVLIMVLGVLAILSVLGVMLTRLTSMERTTARAYRDLVQAKMLAESGVFHGVITTRESIAYDMFKNVFRYFGEDLNTNDKLDGTVEDSNKNGKLETYACPLRRAVHPSFMTDLDDNKILDERDLIEVRGKKLGITGEMNQTDEKKNFFSIRVEDLSARIYVNMLDHPFLQTMLENLAEEVGLSRNVGTRIYQNRGEGYATLKEIKSKANLSDEEYDVISSFLTVYAWLDKKVVKSVPLEERIGRPTIGSNLDRWEPFRPTKIDFPRAPTKDGYAFSGEPIGRAPVNINMALKPVLVALLKGLKGWYLDPLTGAGQSTTYDMLFGTTHRGGAALGRVMETPEINLDMARKIADLIITNRAIKEPVKQWEGPFRSWQQFALFCDNVLWKSPANPAGFLTAQQSDVLKANFNPNSNINDFNPDCPRMYWVDKTDLAYYTTEFIFHPTGYFSIDSIGRVLDQNNVLLAEAEIATVVRIFELYRETTQAEFLTEYWKDNEPINNTISPNTLNGFIETTNDLALQTFPELPEKSYLKEADYDGYISLATVEHNPGKMAFRANYNKKGLSPDVGPAIVPDINGPFRDSLVNQTKSGSWRPGKLFPDGVYAETDSVPIYPYRPPDFDMLAVSMWVKPHFFPEQTARTRVYFTYQYPIGSRLGKMSGCPYGIYSIWRDGDAEPFGRSYYAYGAAWDNASILAAACDITKGTKWGGGVGTPCLNHQGHGHDYIMDSVGQRWGNVFRAGKWLHIGWAHYLTPNQPLGHVVSYDSSFVDHLYVNGQRVKGPYSMGGHNTYCSGGIPSVFTTGYTMLRLGELKSATFINSAPDSTLDEVLIWDNLTLEPAGEEILKIWKEGRYYKENDGLFTSRKIDLVKGKAVSEIDKKPYLPGDTKQAEKPYVILFFATWTQYKPDTLPPDATCEVSILDEKKNPITQVNLKEPGGSYVKDYEASPLKIDEPIRYRVHFKPKTTINDVVLDTLGFDDITLAYYGSPRFLSWNAITQ